MDAKIHCLLHVPRGWVPDFEGPEVGYPTGLLGRSGIRPLGTAFYDRVPNTVYILCNDWLWCVSGSGLWAAYW